jgi:hypothetical protein
MKKICSLSKMMLALLVVGLAFASCSSSESIKDKLNNYVANDANVIMVGDLQKLLDVTGTKANDKGQLELSDNMNSLINQTMAKSDRKFLDNVLDFEGIDYSNVVVAFKIANNEFKYCELIFSVVDDKTFAKSLDDYEFEADEDEGFSTYTKDGASILVKGSTGFMIISKEGPLKSSKAIAQLQKIQDSIKDDSAIAGWKVDYLTQDALMRVLVDGKMFAQAMQQAASRSYGSNRGTIAQFLDMMTDAKLDKAFFGLGLNVKDATATLDSKVFDSEGKDFKVEGQAKFDNALLKYTTKDDIAAVAFAADVNSKSFKKQLAAFDQLGFGSESETIKAFVNDLGGSIFMAGGPKSWNYFGGKYTDFHFIIAFNVKSGKGAQFLSRLEGLWAQNGVEGVERVGANYDKIRVAVGGHYEESEEYYYGEWVNDYGDLFVKVDGDYIIFSNEAITTANGGKFNKDVFNGGSFACSLVIDKADLKQFNIPFGVTFNGKAENASADLSFSLTGADGSLLDIIMNAITSNIQKGSPEAVETVDADYDVVEPDYYAVDSVAAID